MAEPEWAQVLTAIYREGKPIKTPYNLGEVPSRHVLVRSTEVSADDLEDTLAFLREQNLIEMITHIDESNREDEDTIKTRTIKLRPEGFEVAHERELSYQESAGNVAVAGLTAVLGLTAFVETTIAYASGNWEPFEVLSIGLTLVVVGVIILYIWNRLVKAGAINIDELVARRERHKDR